MAKHTNARSLSPNSRIAQVETIENAHEMSRLGNTYGVLGDIEGQLPMEDPIEYDKAEVAKIVRKVDWRLVPLLSILYLVSFIDKGNLGNAAIAGMTEDLKLKGLMYNTALTIFFPAYIFFEVPSNIMLKLMRPSIWIAILLFSWGTVTTLMGVVNSYAGLLACRFFLGVTEAGFFPAASYLLTIWYQRYELQFRMAIFYAAASVSGAFSGLLAFGLEAMKGIAGLNGWQWIFIIEGLIPVALALVIWKILPDSPRTASFLTQEEKVFLENRLAIDSGLKNGNNANHDRVQRRDVVKAFKDWKTWCAVVVFLGNSVGVYGFTATAPTVVKQLGYSSANAQLMTIPVYVFAMIVTLAFAFWSDRVQRRSPFVIVGYSLSLIGFAVQLAIPHPGMPGLTYAFLFPVAAGIYCPLTTIVTWVANNSAPSSKRAITLAILISAGNIGGIIGSNVYVSSQAPRYIGGYSSGLASSGVAILAAIVLRNGYAKENKKRRAQLDNMGEHALRSQFTEETLADMGDESPFFYYTL